MEPYRNSWIANYYMNSKTFQSVLIDKYLFDMLQHSTNISVRFIRKVELWKAVLIVDFLYIKISFAYFASRTKGCAIKDVIVCANVYVCIL